MAALAGFDRWSIRTVPRAQNARADALVNAALDQARAASVQQLVDQCSGWAEAAIASICAFDSSSSSVFVSQYRTPPERQPMTWMCEPSSTSR